MAAVFLDIEKAFEKMWHSGLLYKLSEFKFLSSPIKLVTSFLTDRKFSLGRRRIFYTKKYSSRGTSRFILVPVLYSLFIIDASTAPGSCLALFAASTCIYVTEVQERQFLTSCNAASLQWSHGMKINEWRTQTTYFSRKVGVPEDKLQLNEWGILFVNNVMYLVVTFNRRMIRDSYQKDCSPSLVHVLKDLFLFKNKCPSTNIKLMLY
jgi:hypothetical protein